MASLSFFEPFQNDRLDYIFVDLFQANATSEEEYEELPLIEALNGKMDGASTAELGKPTIYLLL